MLGVTPEMAFFFILFSNCQSSVGQTKNLMGFVNSSYLSTSEVGAPSTHPGVACALFEHK